MKLKTLGLTGLAVAGIIVGIAIAKKLFILGLIGAAVYYFAIRPILRARANKDAQ